MRPWLAITLGDPSGIGPEVTLKALAAAPDDRFKYLLLGDVGFIQELNGSLGTQLKIEPFTSYDVEGTYFCQQTGAKLDRPISCGSAVAAESAVAALLDGIHRAVRGEVTGIVTAPVNKESIIKLGKPFTGQTEMLAELSGTRRCAMMLLGADDRERWLRVALVTTHLPLRAVADQITEVKVIEKIQLATAACKDLGLKRARVAVCGLNPHAGEGGAMGTEEVDTIIPAVEKARSQGYDVEGPIAADTLFYYAYRGEYDAVVAMYHDQGLAPLKMIGFETGINWTLGLPFIRTSPDHGTAYNIAGQNKAHSGSMIAALNLARKLALARIA